MPLVIDDPRQVESAYARQYETLARAFANLVPKRNGNLAEIGCGKGQLTVPLAKFLPHHRFDAVDKFSGAYSGTLSRLNHALSQARMQNRVKVHKGDYLDWLWDEFSDKYVGVISSEFLPEIDSYELSMFMPECYRVVKHGGLTAHSFLSATPRNNRQRLLIEADTNPKWTKTPPKEWFSPKPAVVVSKLIRTGFREVRVRRIKSNLIIRGNAAKELLRSWDVRSSFWKKYKTRLMRAGLEFPDWLLVSGLKP
jgi:16S rRNA A1518/A1519 N6-dimethyltransferase RsmA/KsgA/DIM1 with predicted DNA glycosylase/AP lyase activity